MGGKLANRGEKVNSRTSYFPLGAGLLLGGLHLLALSSFAIARQYFEPLSKGGDFFIERGATSLDVVLFALALVLLPPAACLLVEWVAGLISARLRSSLHLIFIGSFMGLICWQFLTDPARSVSPRLAEVLGLVVGALAALAYARVVAVRSWLTVLSFAPVVVLALFLVFSPVRALVFGGGLERPQPRASTGAPVVMVVLDELPATSLMNGRGNIDADRLPGFARLARDSTWYRDDATVADFTQLAVPSLLTGSPALHDQLQVASEHPHNLFTLLGGSYRLNVWEFNTDLCPEPVCRQQGGASFGRRMRKLASDAVDAVPALPGGLRSRLADALAPAAAPPPRPGGSDRDDVRVQLRATQDVRFERFLASLRPSRGHTLDFLHLLLPHRPWVYLPSGQRYTAGRPYADSLFARLPRDPRAVAVAYQRHLLQVGAVDRMLTRLIDRLERLGLYKGALVVVTADHGASFRPGDQPRIVTPTNVAEIASVPLFIKRPGQRRGVVVDTPVESIDVLPELARLLHVGLPWSVAGRPLRARHRQLVLRRQRGGGEVEISRPRLARLRDVALSRNGALLGRDLYALGPGRELIGRRLPALAPPGRLRATIDGADRYRNVDPEGRRPPLDVSGLVKGERPRVRGLAVAVNGRVAATAWTLVGNGQEYFTALVPPSSFRRGANRVEVLALERRGRGLVLVPLGR